MSVTTDMAQTLKEARRDAGLLQKDVARHLGIERWAYNRAESGHRLFDLDWIRRLPVVMQRPLALHLRRLLQQDIIACDMLIDALPLWSPDWATQPAAERPRIKRPVSPAADPPRPSP